MFFFTFTHIPEQQTKIYSSGGSALGKVVEKNLVIQQNPHCHTVSLLHCNNLKKKIKTFLKKGNKTLWHLIR